MANRDALKRFSCQSQFGIRGKYLFHKDRAFSSCHYFSIYAYLDNARAGSGLKKSVRLLNDLVLAKKLPASSPIINVKQIV